MLAQLSEKHVKIAESGSPFPLGATLLADGVNFAVYSKNATEVSLLLFDSPGGAADRYHPIPRPRQTRLARTRKGVEGRPTLRLQGGRRLPSGIRTSLQRLQIAARSVRQSRHRQVSQHRQPAARLRCAAGRGGRRHRTRATIRQLSPRQSSSTMQFDWQGVRSPDFGLEELVIYEVHVKGFTAHPSSGVRCSRNLPRLYRKDPLPRQPRRKRRGTAAGPRVLRRRLSGRPRSHQLLGLQLDRLLRARIVLRQSDRLRAGRSPSSRRWCANSIARASR